MKQEELKEKFELLLKGSSSKIQKEDVIQVGNVEIRCKNQDNYFGFVDIHGTDSMNGNGVPLQLHKGINNCVISYVFNIDFYNF